MKLHQKSLWCHYIKLPKLPPVPALCLGVVSCHQNPTRFLSVGVACGQSQPGGSTATVPQKVLHDWALQAYTNKQPPRPCSPSTSEGMWIHRETKRHTKAQLKNMEVELLLLHELNFPAVGAFVGKNHRP